MVMAWTGKGGPFGWYLIHEAFAGRVWERTPGEWRAIGWRRDHALDDHEIKDLGSEDAACAWVERWISGKEQN